MSFKIKRTTFGVMTSHVISSSVLFPLIWLIVGSIGKSILISDELINETLANSIYYAVMLLMFYFGTKYSLYYIDKKVSVAMPKHAQEQSIILFTSLFIAVNYGLYYLEDSLNFMRIFFSIAVIYIFFIMTQKYFSSLENAKYTECTFFGQITILLANLSVLIALLCFYGIFSSITPLARYILLVIVLFIAIKTELFNNIFVSYFYKTNEVKPLKHAVIMLSISLPINAALYFFIMNYFIKSAI